jgi:dihydroorotase
MIDPAIGLHAVRDLGIKDGRCAEIAPTIPGAGEQSIDASGLFVMPGLVDLHVHVFTGVTTLAVEADPHCLARGATTIMDAGSAGANTFPGFLRYVIEQVQVRTLAFLNLSAMGQVDQLGELVDFRWAMVDRLVEVARANPETIVGVKVRLSRNLVGSNGPAALDSALQAAQELGKPLMVHIGDTERPVGEILDRLRPGDILTHCYTGWKPGILDEEGLVIPEARDARRRGVIFDVGHGQGSFTFAVAERALEQGFPPDTVSSDLHRFNVDGPVFDLVTTLSKFVYLGLPFDDVIAMATARPSAIVGRGRDFGSLQPGMPADVTLVRLDDGPTTLIDAAGETRVARQRLTPMLTMRAGKPHRIADPAGVRG